MPSTLSVTKLLTNDTWTITATIVPGGFLPIEIFVYENTGSTALGLYSGVVGAVDLPRIQIWQGTIIPAFGNKYVRHSVGTLTVSGSENPDDAISRLKASVEQLSKTFQVIQSTTQVFTII